MNRMYAGVILMLFFLMSFSSRHPAVADDDYNAFKSWMNEQTESFKTYKDERDGEFVNFLKKQWREFEVSKGIVRDTTPKPVAMPVAPERPRDEIPPPPRKILKPVKVPVKLPEKLPDKVTTPESPKKPPIITRPVIEQPEREGLKLKIDFYETSLVLYADPEFQVEVDRKIDKTSIAAYWDKMSNTDYESFLLEAKKTKTDLKLNDWGYHLLLYKAGEKIYRRDKNKARMFVWFMSTKAGYDARLAYQNDKVFLLYPSKDRLYGIPYLTISDQRYYMLTFNEKPEKFDSLFTYKGKYPRSDAPLDYRIHVTPNLNEDLKKRDLKFEFKGKTYSVSMVYNKSLIEFFEYYPQPDIKVYFSAGVARETEDSMVESLKPLVDGKSQVEAVNMLLRFVQTAFQYKTDDMQFQRENYLLPEETLYYPYSDCEDRAFLFAYLVRRLINLDVVGLGFPGHVATAVHFSDDVSGDYVTVKGKRYAICDPTYINATSGMAMPQFKTVKPDVIFID